MPQGFVLPSLDVAALARGYQVGLFTPTDVIRGVLCRIEHYADPAAWICRVDAETLLKQAHAIERRRASGENLALFGVPFAVKDNIDVAGYPTTSACPAFAYEPAVSAPVVDRLLRAGAIFVGKTNLDQFGTGLAGDRSPYGACCNVFKPEYIAGGSSSGSAVAVAAGLVSFALGSDTAGSGRVPAGCNNIVGLKPTPGWLSTNGLVPNCQELDGISIFALTVEDAQRICEIASEGRVAVSMRPMAGKLDITIAVPGDGDLEFCGDKEQASLFAESLRQSEKRGARRQTIDFKPFQHVANLLYEGPWIAERLANVDEFFQAHPGDVYPVTRTVIEKGLQYSAVDTFKGFHKLRELRSRCLRIFDRADVSVVPTMPTIPTLAEVQADSMGWSRRLGYYTNFVNLLGMAGLAVPSGFTPRGLPGGITLLGPGGSDQHLCEIGMEWQRGLNLPLGATGKQLPADTQVAYAPGSPARGFVRVAVAAAHLHGQPLHPDLRRTGARFVRACRTASRYRFLALMDLKPPRPGLLRDDHRAGAVDVEIYDVPFEGFGMLVASVAPPLAIGTIELADGEAVKGFLCESFAATRARDITEFGGWVAFRKHLATNSA